MADSWKLMEKASKALEPLGWTKEKIEEGHVYYNDGETGIIYIADEVHADIVGYFSQTETA